MCHSFCQSLRGTPRAHLKNLKSLTELERRKHVSMAVLLKDFGVNQQLRKAAVEPMLNRTEKIRQDRKNAGKLYNTCCRPSR